MDDPRVDSDPLLNPLLQTTEIGHEKAQSVIDSITSSYAAEGQSSSNPMLAHPPGGPGQPFPPPPFGFGGGMPPPPFGMPGGPPLPGSAGLPPRKSTFASPPFSLPTPSSLFAHRHTANRPFSRLTVPLAGRGMPMPMPGMPLPFPPPFAPVAGGAAGGLPPPLPNGMPFPPPGGLPPNFQFPPPGGAFPPPMQGMGVGLGPGPQSGGGGGFGGGERGMR
ncbi:hypothetical protein MMC16_004744 [Acarospora aff. strigata]|nr:hypothetical protein [Acarospora aff. strigata]